MTRRASKSHPAYPLIKAANELASAQMARLTETWYEDEAVEGAVVASELPTETRGLTARLIRNATAEVRTAKKGRPTQLAVAEQLGTSESTLKRAMKELGMGAWPPAPPDD
jgi:hypothetical protein